jgi:hypothetical protein
MICASTRAPCAKACMWAMTPERRARERRRIIHDLRSLERRLQELERERVRLLARQSDLVAERDRTVHKEKTRCEW